MIAEHVPSIRQQLFPLHVHRHELDAHAHKSAGHMHRLVGTTYPFSHFWFFFSFFLISFNSFPFSSPWEKFPGLMTHGRPENIHTLTNTHKRNHTHTKLSPLTTNCPFFSLASDLHHSCVWEFLQKGVSVGGFSVWTCICAHTCKRKCSHHVCCMYISGCIIHLLYAHTYIWTSCECVCIYLYLCKQWSREVSSSGLLLRLLCIIPNKQLITRVLNHGELVSSGS